MAKAATKLHEKKPKESAEERFTRLANFRVNAALKRLHMIGNLAGPSYKSTPEQREKIVEALQESLTTVKTKFDKTEHQEKLFAL